MMTRRQVLLGTFLLIMLISLGGVLLSDSGLRPELTIRIAMLGSSKDEDYDGAMAFGTPFISAVTITAALI